MKNLNKKLLVQSILDCLWPLDSSDQELKIESSALFFIRDEWVMYFGKEEAKEFRAALEQITQYEPLAIKYSNKAISGSFESILVKLSTTHETRPPAEVVKHEIDTWLDNMLMAVDLSITYSALIENLLVDNEICIGKVKIEPINEGTITSVKNSFFAQIDKNQHSTEDEKEIIKQRLLSDFSTLESNKFASLASISIPSKDVEKGLEVAIERIRETVDVLRFLGAFVRRSHPKETIALQGEFSAKEKHYFALSETGLWGIYYRDIPHPFKLDNKQLTYFEKFGSSSFFEILEKNIEQRSELENRLINAIRWVSEAIRETSEQTRFLKLCISLESLLCGRNEEAFGTTIGERLAFLLEKTSEKRKFIFHKTKSIYNIRSDIAHEGKPEKADALTESMPYALAYSVRVIIKVNELIRELQWQDFNELRRYIEDIKFDDHEKN